MAPNDHRVADRSASPVGGLQRADAGHPKTRARLACTRGERPPVARQSVDLQIADEERVTDMISVIVPTFEEADRIHGLLAALRREPVAHEVIVVDGGSRDDTLTIAAALGARTALCARGRGRQLRTGSLLARGDILLFLHADSVFPVGGLAAVVDRLADRPGVIGGNFRLRFDGDDRFSRWLDGFYAWIRRRGVYYGDSGIFVRHRVYRTLGGVRAIALMEDYDFVRRLERYGTTCCIEEPPLTTSSRRFAGRHPIAIVAGWLLIHGLFHLGVSTEVLARLYGSDRRRRGGPLPPQGAGAPSFNRQS